MTKPDFRTVLSVAFLCDVVLTIIFFAYMATDDALLNWFSSLQGEIVFVSGVILLALTLTIFYIILALWQNRGRQEKR